MKQYKSIRAANGAHLSCHIALAQSPQQNHPSLDSHTQGFPCRGTIGNVPMEVEMTGVEESNYYLESVLAVWVRNVSQAFGKAACPSKTRGSASLAQSFCCFCLPSTNKFDRQNGTHHSLGGASS